MKSPTSFYPLLLALLLQSCSGSTQSKYHELSPEFRDYWYTGQAEIASYELTQARYGELRHGEAVLIFVTEPFSKSKHVKLDEPATAGDDQVSVMKLNYTKKFLTGIYPYSMMFSTFTPVDWVGYPQILKLTCTSQEWCGHTFLQVNYRDNRYALDSYSYFESEGDQRVRVRADFLEDELWTRIRLNPENLPTGNLLLFPSSFYLRLRHQPLQSEPAKASLAIVDSTVFWSDRHMKYQLDYDDRSMAIYFENEFPHRILGWEETYRSGFGPGAQTMTTTGRLIKAIQLDYWKRNSTTDLHYRKELGLSTE